MQPFIDMALMRKNIEIDFIFSGQRGIGPISDVAVDDRSFWNTTEVSPSFPTRVQQTESCGHDVAKMTLGHKGAGCVERIFARSDLLDQRRAEMHNRARFFGGDD
jgi:hypothetical protein